ncbi:hypothetical protein DMP07_06505 [Slackia faecicanis]|uniref:Uncharacterized protein n=1 Tax=Slackia faecicanis TaxID=255723 RepID=A0A3N0AEF5_9ACTN|nr:hypothetical protein [Slackia faecicanis]RNL19617.1 hypothetical protein DMP07_06505 [Slackia faecicanis]
MAKSSVSRKTRIAAGIVAACAAACILYSRAASRVGAAGLITYAAGAASMILAALLLGGICAVLTGTVLRGAWDKGRNQRLEFSYKEALRAERPVLLCAASEVAGVVGVWALGIAVSGFLPYGTARMVLVAGVAIATIAWVVIVWRVFRARFGNRCNVVLLRGRVISDVIIVTIAVLACAALALGVVRFSRLAIDMAAGPQNIEASIVEIDTVKRAGDARKGGFSGEVTEVDFAEVQGGVEGSTLHRIELASIDGDEIEFFATSAVGDRIRIVFYPRTETLVSATFL